MHYRWKVLDLRKDKRKNDIFDFLNFDKEVIFYIKMIEKFKDGWFSEIIILLVHYVLKEILRINSPYFLT